MRHSLLLVIVVLTLFGCEKDPLTPVDTGPGPLVTKGVYILNEGNFGDPSGARLTLYDTQRDSVQYDVFESANGGLHLGSTGDDIRIYRDRLYVLMSGSESLRILDFNTHTLVKTVAFPGWSPHSMIIDSVTQRVFVSRLYKNSLGILDLGTMQVLGTVAVGANPQEMVLAGGRLFVCNSGYGSDRTVSVINLSTKVVERTLQLSDGPTGITVAEGGVVWVACTGNAFGPGLSPTGRVFAINQTTLAVVDSFAFPTGLWGSIAPGRDGSMYVIGVTAGSYYGGPIHRITPSTRSVTMEFIAGTYYALAVDGNTGNMYVADAKSFTANGEVRVFSSTGVLKRTLAAQRGPGAFAFKHEE